ncbi:hypothetical protein S40288_04647 [Stachybotrys chartarum IBT 40288]|nr:hypothetical protein S40288_04647 [Stachybotrys chartarum IBT 40288]
MFQLAQHIKPVPSVIYRLLQSIIDARTQAHAIFQQMASEPWSGTETEQRHSPPFHRRPHSSFEVLGAAVHRRLRDRVQGLVAQMRCGAMPSRSLPRASDYGKTWILSWTRNTKSDHGSLHGEFILEQGLQKNGISRGDPDTHQLEATILEALKDEFREFLGESKYASGLHTITPSRFSNTNTNTNGIWEYSPFLCGAEKKRKSANGEHQAVADSHAYHQHGEPVW